MTVLNASTQMTHVDHFNEAPLTLTTKGTSSPSQAAAQTARLVGDHRCGGVSSGSGCVAGEGTEETAASLWERPRRAGTLLTARSVSQPREAGTVRDAHFTEEKAEGQREGMARPRFHGRCLDSGFTAGQSGSRRHPGGHSCPQDCLSGQLVGADSSVCVAEPLRLHGKGGWSVRLAYPQGRLGEGSRCAQVTLQTPGPSFCLTKAGGSAPSRCLPSSAGP